MTTEKFLDAIQGCLNFLADVFTGLWSFLTANPWLLSMVIAPILVALIIFGVSIAFSLMRKNDDRKGER